MIKFYIAGLFFLIQTKVIGQAWSNDFFVHRDGKDIVNGFGKKVKLDGFNLGGWLMWEGWIWGGGFTQEKVIYEKIKSKVGAGNAEAFQSNVYKNFITRSDIKKISEQCFNVVRIPFNHTILEDDNSPFLYKQSGFDILDSVLRWCEEYNVYAVLDLHSAPGGQATLFTADSDPIDLWSSLQNRERTVKLWKAIAERYKSRGIIAGYDLLNEPNTSQSKLLLDLYKNIIAEIRKVDTNHMIFIEGNDYARDFSSFDSLLDNNMAFEFHIYTFLNESVEEKLSAYENLSRRLNVPIWCGEWGENTTEIVSSTLKKLKLSNYNISGTAFWTWKKQYKLIQFPCYYCYFGSFQWDKTTEWIGNNNSAEPTVAEVREGITHFLTYINSEKCVLNNSLYEILGNCTVAATLKGQSSSFEVFPNPTTDLLSVKNSDNNPFKVSIFDSVGKLVGEHSSSEHQLTIDVSKLSSGIYTVNITSGNSQMAKKISLIE